MTFTGFSREASIARMSASGRREPDRSVAISAVHGRRSGEGAVRGAQRHVSLAPIYDRCMPKLLERIRQRGTQPAEDAGAGRQ